MHAVDVLINRRSCSDCDWSKDAASPDGVARLSCRLVLHLVHAHRLTLCFADRRPGSRVVCDVFPVFLISVCFDVSSLSVVQNPSEHSRVQIQTDGVAHGPDGGAVGFGPVGVSEA